MRIATYTRISTDEDRQPFSLGAQAERLDAYARSQDGWRITRAFSDQASGATLEREGLQRALSEASAGVYELLLVYRVDRLSRNVRQLAQLAEDLDRAGVALRSATEPFDTSSAAGRMMLQMLGVFAEFERTTIVERITAGMERAASQGRWVVGRVPYGYVREAKTKLIQPLPAQAEVVRRVFSLYTERQMGAAEIAKRLNAEGHAPATGVPFSARSVIRLLSNPIYTGRIGYKGATYPGLHDPIVEREAFDAAQRILAERGDSQALKRGHPSEFLLSGLIRCGRCRRAFVGTSAHGRTKRYRYYTCSTRYRYGTASCDAERLSGDELEEAVLEQVAEVFADTTLVAEAIAQADAAERRGGEESAQRLAAVRQELAAARRGLDRYFAAFEEGSLSPADCGERIAHLKARIEALESEEASLAQDASEEAQEPVTAEEIAGWARDLRELLENGSAQQRKELLRKLVKELKVTGSRRVEPTYKVPALVRAPGHQVDLRGVEPLTSCLPSTRSTN
jgi:site-specific DNA recombinase